MSKKLVWMGAMVGSTLGGLLPMLWHASLFSFSSILLSMIGGVAGIWLAWRIERG
jgi:hypothetical protein